MSKVIKEEIDALNAKLNITIEKSDYEPALNEELSKYRKQAQIKGFRKGKTPMSVIRKMYGRAIMADVINKKLGEEIYSFIKDSEDHILGQPLASSDQEQVDFDPKAPEDYHFKFDIAQAPDFEIQGLDDGKVFTEYKIDVTEDMYMPDIESARTRFGDRESVDDGIQENDMLTLKAQELDADKKVVEDGLGGEFKVLMQYVKDDAIKDKLFSSNKGDILQLDLKKLEDVDEEFIRKNYLALDEPLERKLPELFEVTIEDVVRVKPAELDEEFFKKFFGTDEIKTIEDAKERMTTGIQEYYKNHAESLIFKDLQEHLMESNEIELPEAFLKRWLLATNEEITKELLEEEFPYFKKNLKWTLIKDKLVKKHEVSVDQAEIQEGLKRRVRGYFAQSNQPADENMVNMLAESFMKEEEQVNEIKEAILTDKIFNAIYPNMAKEEKLISHEEFNAIMDKANEETEAARVGAAAKSTSQSQEEEEE